MRRRRGVGRRQPEMERNKSSLHAEPKKGENQHRYSGAAWARCTRRERAEGPVVACPRQHREHREERVTWPRRSAWIERHVADSVHRGCSAYAEERDQEHGRKRIDAEDPVAPGKGAPEYGGPGRSGINDL